ncbi:flagellin [Pseudoxanthomonas mexicana]|uniref:Flagellin n=1 Tax=Pseudoxanthomonas mexicana TaxID=128785 RepID=A0A7G9TAF5_PSEMX|nr:flagellin [Pseudoxanthomonas mexicana]MCA0299348.1 flagellin [Pseudomonadota bacterium]QLQ29024.1 MAG: flagellin [Pseudoxanthomonas sp.]QND81190.1 flagellin [Pseudoxanthomonas mexicana]QNN77080.1 flagellin [Pseudoxanthomonas mexicana]
MAQVINTNTISLNAQRNLGTSGASLATTIQRLSSGLRINSAKDDAAGLAISERFSTQIRGLDVAVRNANDGISLAQVAEGSLTEIGNNLQRIRELSVQSANATNSSSDRAALNAEVKQLTSEIDRVAKQADFNGTKLLDGTFSSQLFQVGANAGQAIAVDKVVDARSQSLGNVKFAADVTGTAIADAGADGSIAGLTINSVAIDTVAYTNGTSGDDIAKTLATAINAKMGETGVYASVTADQVTLNSVKAGKDLVVGGTVAGSGLTAATTTAAATATASFAKDLDITTFEGAQKALEIVDAALTSVNSARADLGAVQNRFTSVVANLQTSSENLAASRSRIRDTDFAKETAELTRTQILQQAGTAMLAQANQVPQNVLSLLR